MAYFNYNSNYSQGFESNNQYYDQYYYYYNHDYSNQEPRYVHYNSDTEFYGNSYQHAPTPSLVGYYYSTCNNQSEFLSSKNANFHGNGEYYYDPVSTEYVVSYNSTIPEEATIDVVEADDDHNHDSKTFHGGYDINEKYGKPLPPSEEICHPPSKIDPNLSSLGDFSYGSVPSPYVKEDQKVVIEAADEPKQTSTKVVQEEKSQDFDDGEEEEDDDDYDEEEEDDDDEYDDDDDGEEDEEEKKDDSSKEPSRNDPIVPLVGVLPIKEVHNQEGEAKPKNDNLAGEMIQREKELDLKVGEEEKGKGNLGEANPQNGGIVSEIIQQEKAQEEEEEEEEDDDDDDDCGDDGDDGDDDGGGGDDGGDDGDDDDGDDDEQAREMGEEGRKEENYGNEVRRQIPPGYGIEAFDVCEGIFGGYFPCLWKRNQRIYNHQRDVVNHEKVNDYDFCLKETADYLFGNPNPYGGTMPEKGSYGDPVYCYQRHHPQQPLTGQVEGHSSWLHTPTYYYGQNN